MIRFCQPKLILILFYRKKERETFFDIRIRKGIRYALMKLVPTVFDSMRSKSKQLSQIDDKRNIYVCGHIKKKGANFPNRFNCVERFNIIDDKSTL